MASKNRSKINNPEGRNQYSNDWVDLAKDRPMATAAAAAAAVGAGVFLWSRRNQISEQLSHLSDQIGEWTSSIQSSRQSELETVGADTGKQSTSTRSSRSGRAIGGSETGAGNAALGAHSGSEVSAGNAGRTRA